MAKLSAEVLAKGRQLVVSSDLDGLMLWIQKNAPTVDAEVVRETYAKVFKADNTSLGLKMFHKVFDDYDANIDRAGTLIRLFVPAFLFLGALGGVLYLAHVLIGH